MDWSERTRKVLDFVWFVTWAIVSSVWCVTAAGELSATWDEPIYLHAGLERWRSGSHRPLIERGVMPLPVEVVTLSLYFWERFHGIQFDVTADLDRFLPWARAGNLIFWWLLLFFAWKAGCELAGAWAGRIAVALLCCEPTLLAHASLATTDISIAACVVALAYSYRNDRDSGWLRRVALPGLWLALALLAKASALVFAPLCLVVVGFVRNQSATEASLRPRDICNSLWRSLLDSRDVLMCEFVLALLYCFTAAEGLLRQVQQNVHGHAAGAYLLGESRPGGFWDYFPVALSIKLTLPLLILPVLLAVFRPRSLANWPCLSATALLVATPTFRVQTGVQFVLPLVALAVVGLAGGVVLAWQACAPGRRRQMLTAGVVLSMLWSGWSAVTVWPHGLCYANELWGGTPNSYRLLSDSNFDWGQGLKDLACWQRRNGITQLDVWYFGTDLPLSSLPMRRVYLEDSPTADSAISALAGHHLAVSTTLLHGSHTQAGTLLHNYPTVARTMTFVIYDFTHSSPLAIRNDSPHPR